MQYLDVSYHGRKRIRLTAGYEGWGGHN